MHWITKSYFIYITLFSQLIFAQENTEVYGGEFVYSHAEQCISNLTRRHVKEDIRSNILGMQKNKNINSKLQTKQQVVSFQWPLRMVPNQLFNKYYGISNFVDHDPQTSGSQFGTTNLDYNCGNRSYDTTNGYNHSGVDYFLWPFQWYMFTNDIVEVIAAESGTIVAKYDGYFDQNCSCVNSQSNSIHIRHNDGSEAWYWHLKNNSVSPKNIGQTVSAGEYLGIVGSSGCSTDPHLHFEIYDNLGNLIDPYQGNCNSLNQNSWWANQPDYYEPTLNAVLTHDAPPQLGCPAANEVPNFRNCFNPGQTIYTAFYYSDQLAGMNSQMSIHQPDGSMWTNWNHSSPQYYTASYWYWQYILPTNGPFGNWSLEVEFDTEIHSYSFYYGTNDCSCPLEYSVTNGNKLTGTQTSNIDFESFGQIQSNQIILSNSIVNYDSGTQISLDGGFEVISGSMLHVFIDGCGGL